VKSAGTSRSEASAISHNEAGVRAQHGHWPRAAACRRMHGGRAKRVQNQTAARLSGRRKKRRKRRGNTGRYSSYVSGGPGKTRRSTFRAQDRYAWDWTPQAGRKLRLAASERDSPEHNRVRHSGNSLRQASSISGNPAFCRALSRDIIHQPGMQRFIEAPEAITVRFRGRRAHAAFAAFSAFSR
jgi:hypothetical protein